jgi:hypothetical protein
MAAGDRAAERGALRLLGATKPQVLRYVMAEALLDSLSPRPGYRQSSSTTTSRRGEGA